MNTLIPGFGFILLAAVAGGAFGLQYRVMRKYSVENAALLSFFFATIVVPLIAAELLLPGWRSAISEVGFQTNLLVFALGFCWGLGAITYAYGFNILGMALASALLKGLSVAVGAGIPLVRHWGEVPVDAKVVTIVGIGILLLGTAIAGKAGMMRERFLSSTAEDEDGPATESLCVTRATGRLYVIGLLVCIFSGLFSAGANLGYEYAQPLQDAAKQLGNVAMFATLIRWMPMYWGGMAALLIFQGGTMLRRGTWRSYLAKGSARDFAIASSMGLVHFLAQIPYGLGAYYLGTLGTTVGWGAFLGTALIVAVSLGFITGEWRKVPRAATLTIKLSVAVLILAMIVLAYANTLV